MKKASVYVTRMIPEENIAELRKHFEVEVNPAFVRENEVKSLRGDNSRLIGTIGSIESIPLKKTLQWMFEAYTQK